MVCLTANPQAITLQDRPELSDQPSWYDLVSDAALTDILPCISLQPYQFMWLVDSATE